MNIEVTTVAVVTAWAGILPPPPLNEGQSLQALGANIGGTFYPDLCQDLLTKLLAAFPQYPNLNRDLTLNLFYDSVANATGTIKTTTDIVRTIITSVSTPFTRFMEAIKTPFRFVTKMRKRK
jgi:hypothetical protein